jgi:hypothetical protein
MTINWPSGVGFSSLNLTPANVVAVSESPFTLERTTYEFTGERWDFDASIVSLRGVNARALMCTILQMRQMANSVTIPISLFGDDFALKGAATGTIKVDGASQTGRTINLKDAPHSVTVFKAGDFLNIGTKLYTALADAISDSSGDVAVSLWPSVLVAPSDGDTIIYSAPTITVQLLEASGFSFSTDKIMNASIKAAEVI